MTSRTQVTTEQLVAIVVGIALGFASAVPRKDLANYFSNSLGELGGYFASLLAMASIGGLVGLLVHDLVKRYRAGHESKA